jgi:hypothetical protein
VSLLFSVMPQAKGYYPTYAPLWEGRRKEGWRSCDVPSLCFCKDSRVFGGFQPYSTARPS